MIKITNKLITKDTFFIKEVMLYGIICIIGTILWFKIRFYSGIVLAIYGFLNMHTFNKIIYNVSLDKYFIAKDTVLDIDDELILFRFGYIKFKKRYKLDINDNVYLIFEGCKLIKIYNMKKYILDDSLINKQLNKYEYQRFIDSYIDHPFNIK